METLDGNITVKLHKMQGYPHGMGFYYCPNIYDENIYGCAESDFLKSYTVIE